MSGKKEEKEKTPVKIKNSAKSSSPRSPPSASLISSRASSILNDILAIHYYMGRLNPIHEGHLNAIATAINDARAKGSIPLIILGNGPSPKKKNLLKGQTRANQIIDEIFDILDNPIDFVLKKEFIESKLPEISHKMGFAPFDPSSYLIVEKEEYPATQVSEYLRCRITSRAIENPIDMVEIYNVAGDKDDDARKLNFISAKALETVTDLGYTGSMQTIKIHAGENPMSATKVRLAIYKQILPQIYKPTEESVAKLTKYEIFYGETWPQIFETIDRIGRSIDPNILCLYIECNGDKENLKKINSVAKKISKGTELEELEEDETPLLKYLPILEQANIAALRMASTGLGFKENFTRKRKRENKYRSSKKPKRFNRIQTKGSRQGPRQRSRQTKRHRKTKRR